MAILQDDLKRAAPRYARSLQARYGQRTAFLCHSHHDRDLAQGLQVFLRDAGMDLYIDWQDETMPAQPSRETAGRIRRKIFECQLFLYLATQNSANSKWCPWELGYADGKKGDLPILVIPTRDARGGEHGNEYVHLYRRIDRSTVNVLAAYDQSGAYVPWANI